MNKTYNLTITDITTEDEGYYNCVVKNEKNQSDQKTVYLFVKPSNPPGNCTCEK